MIEKYQDLEAVAGKLGIQNLSMREAGGKVSISGHTTYQLEKDRFWDAIKKHAGWENEVAADIKMIFLIRRALVQLGRQYAAGRGRRCRWGSADRDRWHLR